MLKQDGEDARSSRKRLSYIRNEKREGERENERERERGKVIPGVESSYCLVHVHY